ncbi:MAG: RDD family protein [bacterium]
MVNYYVVLKGLVDNTNIGKLNFIEKFAAAYKLDLDKAKLFLKNKKGIIYTCEDKSTAEKGKAFLEKIGGVVEIITKNDESVSPKTKNKPIQTNTKKEIEKSESVNEPIAAKKDITEDHILLKENNNSSSPLITDNNEPRTTNQEPKTTRFCPSCGYSVPAEVDDCPNCHIIISKYENMMGPDSGSSPSVSSTYQPISATTFKEANSYLKNLEEKYVRITCSQCGNLFNQSDVIQIKGKYVCANCKPFFLKRIQEGDPIINDFEYKGFWIRFAAKFIDGIILGVFNGITKSLFPSSISTGNYWTIFALSCSIQLVTNSSYYIFFHGKYGATPGKMAIGAKVVNADGSPISYMKACGRFFAEMLSSSILCIGYIMAAFDEQKRTLHDRICNTFVVSSR